MIRDAVRRWNNRFGTDDAPLWAEVLGAVLAPGLFIRAAVHVWLAIAADAVRDEHVDPHLAGRDITLASPVQGLRGHRVDPAARVVTAVAAFAAWSAWPPSLIGGVAGVWLGANWLVALSDPLQYGLLWGRRLYRTQTTPDRQTPTQ